MRLNWRYFLFLVWVSYLFITSIILFSRGFLLNKTVLNFTSTCQSDNSCIDDVYQASSRKDQVFEDHILKCIDSVKAPVQQYCGRESTKVVILLIDALRYDFVARNDVEEKVYHNKLTIINKLLNDGSGRLYKFIADPPTTTLQRINGLMTGSLPTFIDVGSNFASSEISEDNLIDQMIKFNKSIIFMGDDTWEKLFPGRFLRTYPYPSFNVWDLDTVDSGIKKHLIPELIRDWDVIIAHFLGVDHCGHRYGPNHPEMARKLSEMNEVIEKVASEIDENTILFLIGDHGMTESGDHGGASDSEVSSAMFVYSRNRQLLSNFRITDSLRQIDLTPTLSALLGIPIPFSNVGTTVVNLFPELDFTKLENHLYMLQFFKSTLWANVLQSTSYIMEYSKINSQLPPASLNLLLEKFQSLKLQILQLKSASDWKDLLFQSEEYLQTVREMCESVWVQFDSFSISRGLVLMFLNLTLILILVDGMPSKVFQDLIKSSFMLCGFLALSLSGLITCILYMFNFVSSLELSLYFATNTASLVVFSIAIIINWVVIANNWHLQSKNREWINIFSRVIIIFSTFGLFSNSYVVEESSVISYIMLTLVWTCALQMKTESVKKTLHKIADPWTYGHYFSSTHGSVLILSAILSVLIRISWYYWQCREEQSDKCLLDKSGFKSSLAILTVLAFAVFVTVSRNIFRSFGNLVGFSPPVLISRYVPTMCMIFCGCFWILQTLPSVLKPKLILPWQLQLLPRIVLIVCLFSIIVYFVKPLCIYYVTKDERRNILLADKVSIFNRLKAMFISRTDDSDQECPVVYGLASVYSATFLNIAIFMCLISAILLGESRALVSVILLVSLLLLSLIQAAVRHNKSTSQGDIYSVPWWSVTCWGFSSLYFFYGTGHQATFPGIQWDAAVLMGDIISTFVPGVLVITNTFISQILHSLLLPLLFIFPFTLGVAWPSAAAQHINLKKGEIVLIEQDGLMWKGLFSLAVKYILFHGWRVFISMLAASVHARHLMVWKIFAPKFIFESVAFMVMIPCLLMSLLLMERITTSTQSLMKLLRT